MRSPEQPQHTCPGTGAGVREGFQRWRVWWAPAGTWPPSAQDGQLAPTVRAGGEAAVPQGLAPAWGPRVCLHVGSVREEAPPGLLCHQPESSPDGTAANGSALKFKQREAFRDGASFLI